MAENYACPCGRPDSIENKMVECEECLRYYHFSCANVNDSIEAEDRHFVCTACTASRGVTTRSKSGKSSTSSSQGAKIALDLQRLEEEKQIREKAAQEKVRREEEFLSKKYDLLHAQLDERDEADSIRSRRTNRSTRSINNWLNNQPAAKKFSTPVTDDDITKLQHRTGAIPKQQKNATTAKVPATLPVSGISDQDMQHFERREGKFPGISPIQWKQNPVSTIDLAISPAQPTDSIQQLQHQFQVLAEQMRKMQMTYPVQTSVFQGNRQQQNGDNVKTNTDCEAPRVMLGNLTRMNTSSSRVPPCESNHLPISSVSEPNISNRINSTINRPCPSHVPSNIITNGAHSEQNSTSRFNSHTSSPSVHTVNSYLSPIVSSYISAQNQSPTHPQMNTGPNSQQLATRHVVPKELPTFSGDSVDWPLFLSCYQNSTQMCGYSNGENLMRLQRCLRGHALEAVRCYLMHPSSVPLIIDTLKILFGRPELVINSLLRRVRSTPTPKIDRLETIVNFGLACQNLCEHLRATEQNAHLTNPILLQELVDKLPTSIKLDWSLYKRQFSVVDLDTFGKFMSNLVSAASDVIYTEPSNDSVKHKQKDRMYLNTHCSSTPPDTIENRSSNHKTEQNVNAPKPCTICEVRGHRAKDCRIFLNMNLHNRWKIVQERFLCRRCLSSHGKFPCKASQCDVDNCAQRHHKLLHPGNPQLNPRINFQPKSSETISVHRQIQQSTFFRIIPVILYANGMSFYTFAFLDDGSSSTLMESEVAKKLGLKGESRPLYLKWTNDIERTEEFSQIVNLNVSGCDANARKYCLNRVCTVRNLRLPNQTLNFEQLCNQFPYLRGLPVRSYKNAVPTILIGLDNANLKVPLKSRQGKLNEPVASKSRLGWTVYGKVSETSTTNIHQQLHICVCDPHKDLHDMVKQFFEIESVGATVSPQLESDDNKRARKILNSTTGRLPTGKFQTGLLWKYDHVEFPNSRPMAERRLKCLERRLLSQPDLYARVREQIADYRMKNYIHKATVEELQYSDAKHVWYLPLGVVLNPKKPEKIRVVWDAAATVQGISFNSVMLTGPDLLSSLPSVLCRYRQRQIAISADIREMFLQIGIRPEDKQAQRFLWRNNPDDPPDVFVVDVAIFGSSCSPCIAQYIKNVNAEQFEKQFPQAAAAIVSNHYVDDYLDSLDTIQQAMERAEQVRDIHAHAGFELHHWLSNSKEVLELLGVTQEGMLKSFCGDKQTNTHRVLGMVWHPNQDNFIFTGHFREDLQPTLRGDVTPTKRQLLQVVMSIFDPLGLVSAFIIHGKILIQKVWRSKIDWDDPISNELFQQWKRWTETLQRLHQIRIPRCYFPGYDPKSYDTLELHVFVDASEEAYACAAYSRILDEGRIRCVLVSSKTKVAPLKPLSIPRMELQAAVLGAKLAQAIEKNHTLHIKRRTFWSDSSTVLAWLQSDQRKYRQFVAFRITEILETSSVNEWRWVSSRLNVADEATKWGKGPSFDVSSRWFTGPQFLYEHPSGWPEQKSVLEEVDEELRSIHIHHEIEEVVLLQFERFSKWERVVRTVAFVRRFVYKLRVQSSQKPVEFSECFTRDQLQEAEFIVCRFIQKEAYKDEIDIMSKNQKLAPHLRAQVSKTSKLYKLCPYLDEEGLLRMEGRVSPSLDMLFRSACPIILPRDHYGTYLVVNWYHRQFRHENHETAFNEMRQKFHVSKLRAVFKKVRKQCIWCRVYKATPKVPRMAPLPTARTTPYIRAFSYVGIDYFGPILIKQGRSEVKRWVALFTCLTIRAVHLEVVFSLTTEACKMAIRRFIARRGAPIEIYSDQGTNFIGASRELAKELCDINNQLCSTFTNTVTQWRFNPPSAPHMGGSWERLVRAVKCALASLVYTRKPDDETFMTFLIEAEAMVNSRPLTYMPLESEEHEALTPNCFLMLSTSGVNQPMGNLERRISKPFSNWNVCQGLLNLFWTRWVKEYLPTITKRTKWFAEAKPIHPGDLVVVIDEHTRNGWIRGQVLRVFPGKDGRVRRAEVKTSTSILQRPVVKLAVLEVGGTAAINSQQYGAENVPDSRYDDTPRQ